MSDDAREDEGLLFGELVVIPDPHVSPDATYPGPLMTWRDVVKAAQVEGWIISKAVIDILECEEEQ